MGPGEVAEASIRASRIIPPSNLKLYTIQISCQLCRPTCISFRHEQAAEGCSTFGATGCPCQMTEIAAIGELSRMVIDAIDRTTEPRLV